MFNSTELIHAEGDFFALYGQRMLCLSLIQQAAADLAQDPQIRKADTAVSLHWVMGRQVNNVGRVCRSTVHNGRHVEALRVSSDEVAKELSSHKAHLITFEMAVDGAGLSATGVDMDMERDLVIDRLRRAIVEHPQIVYRAISGCLREMSSASDLTWRDNAMEEPAAQTAEESGSLLDTIAPELMGRMMHGATFESTSGLMVTPQEFVPQVAREAWRVAVA